METRQPGCIESCSSELLTAGACHWGSGIVRWLRWPHLWAKAFFCLGRCGLNGKCTMIVSCVWRLSVLSWKHCFPKVVNAYRGGALAEKASHCSRPGGCMVWPHSLSFLFSLTVDTRPGVPHICQHAFLTKMVSYTEGESFLFLKLLFSGIWWQQQQQQKSKQQELGYLKKPHRAPARLQWHPASPTHACAHRYSEHVLGKCFSSSLE